LSDNINLKNTKIMKKTLFFLVTVLSFFQMTAQRGSVWHKATTEQTSRLDRARININAEGEQYFTLDINVFRQSLVNATDKFSKQAGIVVEFPNMQGEIEKFQVWENSNMEPSFQAQFPEIRSYVGKGITDKGATINFSISPLGVETLLFRPEGGTEFIEGFDKSATAYVLFASKNRNKGQLPFNCTTVDSPVDMNMLESMNLYGRSNNRKYKTLRLALSCTAEYSNYFGSTTASPNPSPVIAAMNATMTRVNGVLEKDLAIHFNMIDNTSVIYYNSATDPYDDAATGSGGTWNAQLQSALTSTLTEAAYDIGHLFGASGGGGNAGCIGCVCVSGQKGSGFTSPGNAIPSGDSFDIDYVVHEMGHQLGGNHSFTFGYEGSIAQTEPGSGSTIMGYAGITSYDVQAHSDPIFCYKNILQIQTNLNTKTCPVSVTMADNTPVVNAGADYTIPIGTAFMLNGTATDADAADVLTYLWEENDLGTSATITTASRVLATKTVGPNFRTFKPSTNTFRYFPQMGKILGTTPVLTVTTGSNANWESCSTVARTLNFTFTARDNVAGGGQTGTDASIITVNATGGAFTVTSQATTGLIYQGLSTQTVTWNAGSTAAAPFNSPTVDILISKNVSTALETFNATTPTTPNPTTWTVIAAGVPNNGSYAVTLPDVTASTATCRFMVRAVGNVFLAVNAKNFTITPFLANQGFSLSNFSLYPNPNKGNFTVKFDSESNNDIAISVNDIRGRLVFEKTYTNTGIFSQNLQLENAQAGVYLVTIKDGDKQVVKKIVIE
jgi:hypothetical protein